MSSTPSRPGQLLPPSSPPAATRSLTQELGIASSGPGQLQEIAEIEDLETSAAAGASGTASPIISLVDRILIEALTSGASDIHVEPQENTLEVRFRLDGVLQKQFEDLPKSLTPAVTSRIKIMAELDIAERRLPQDGRIRRMFRVGKWISASAPCQGATARRSACACWTAGPPNWAWTP